MRHDPQNLRLALHRVWEDIAPDAARELGHQTLTAAQVRDQVMRRIRGSPALDEPTRAVWLSLTADQQDAALIDAFPDGPYMAPGNDDDDIEDDVLTD